VSPYGRRARRPPRRSRALARLPAARRGRRPAPPRRPRLHDPRRRHSSPEPCGRARRRAAEVVVLPSGARTRHPRVQVTTRRRAGGRPRVALNLVGSRCAKSSAGVVAAAEASSRRASGSTPARLGDPTAARARRPRPGPPRHARAPARGRARGATGSCGWSGRSCRRPATAWYPAGGAADTLAAASSSIPGGHGPRATCSRVARASGARPTRRPNRAGRRATGAAAPSARASSSRSACAPPPEPPLDTELPAAELAALREAGRAVRLGRRCTPPEAVVQCATSSSPTSTSTARSRSPSCATASARLASSPRLARAPDADKSRCAATPGSPAASTPAGD